MNHPRENSRESGRGEYNPERFRDENVRPDFLTAVDIAVATMSGRILYNHNVVDAWYLFKQIFGVAQKKGLPVTIVSGHLHADFYNNLIEPLEGLIHAEKPHGIHVYVTEEEGPLGSDNRFAAEILKAREGDPELYSLEYLPMEIPHVIYAGKHAEAFRIEKDPDKKEAIASFGFPEGEEAVAIPVQMAIAESRKRMAEAVSDLRGT